MDARRGPVREAGTVLEAVPAEVVSVRYAGRFDVVGLTLGEQHPPWAHARPGQFVLEPGDPSAGAVRARLHWLAGADQDPVHGTTAELVLPAGRSLAPGARLRLLGPLGHGFSAPREPVEVLLVGHEGGAVPLRWLTARLRARGCVVHLVLSADDPELHLDLPFLRRHARTVVLTTSDDLGSALTRSLDEHGDRLGVVYAAAPGRLLPGLVGTVAARGLACRVSALDLADPSVLCGTGLCGGCDVVLPGGPRSGQVLRACLEGPVVPGEWLGGDAR
jgi:dihydroorotate dehydrogenase electron transfer subunit